MKKFCKISLKYVPKGPLESKSVLVQMAWHFTSDKPLTEP